MTDHSYPNHPEQVFARVPIEYLNDLVEDSNFLRMLNETGVGQWEGWKTAMEKYKKEIQNGTGFFSKSS